MNRTRERRIERVWFPDEGIDEHRLARASQKESLVGEIDDIQSIARGRIGHRSDFPRGRRCQQEREHEGGEYSFRPLRQQAVQSTNQ